MQRSQCWLVLLLLSICQARAGAVVLSEDPLEEKSAEVGVIVRQFTFALLGDPLVQPAGIGLLDFRFYLALKRPSWKLVIHDQLSSSIRSQGLPAVGLPGRGVPPPQLLPLRHNLTEGDGFVMENLVDWVELAYTSGSVTATIGRQPITFGRGKLWRPYDLVGTFALTEVDTEYKPGADAARVDWSPRAGTSLVAVAALGELQEDDDVESSWQGSSFVARAKQTFAWGELGTLAAFVRGDMVGGIDGVVDTGSLAVYGEATVTRLTSRSLVTPSMKSGDMALKAMAGVTIHPSPKIVVSPEVFLNGFGAAAKTEYLTLAQSDRVAIGEQIFLGRYYAAASADWEAHPLLHVLGAALVNLEDPSVLASAGLSYSVAGNTQALLGGYLPIGAQSSEYGLLPYFLYAELKVAL